MYFKDLETNAANKAAYNKRQKELAGERMRKFALRSKKQD